jgi:hypothetical protein
MVAWCAFQYSGLLSFSIDDSESQAHRAIRSNGRDTDITGASFKRANRTGEEGMGPLRAPLVHARLMWVCPATCKVARPGLTNQRAAQRFGVSLVNKRIWSFCGTYTRKPSIDELDEFFRIIELVIEFSKSPGRTPSFLFLDPDAFGPEPSDQPGVLVPWATQENSSRWLIYGAVALQGPIRSEDCLTKRSTRPNNASLGLHVPTLARLVSTRLVRNCLRGEGFLRFTEVSG